MPQKWNAQMYQDKGNFVPTLGEPLLALLNPQADMRVLDIGCGDGILSEKIAETGAQVLGVDTSEDMIAAARSRGIDARLCDAHDLNFKQAFDAVFSNAALHWMTKNPAQVVQNVYNALKPGGIFVGEMGGKGNIAEIQRCQKLHLQAYGLDLDEIAPKFFPDEAEYQGLLEQAGFEVESIQRFERPTLLPDGVSDWLKVFASATLEALPKASVEEFVQQVEHCAKPTLYDPEKVWLADYVRLRFVAHKPV